MQGRKANLPLTRINLVISGGIAGNHKNGHKDHNQRCAFADMLNVYMGFKKQIQTNIFANND